MLKLAMLKFYLRWLNFRWHATRTEIVRNHGLNCQEAKGRLDDLTEKAWSIRKRIKAQQEGGE